MSIIVLALLVGCSGGGGGSTGPTGAFPSTGGGAGTGTGTGTGGGGGGEQPPTGPPVIASLSPTSGQPNSSFQINGSKFGPTQGTVSVNGKNTTISSWTNNLIVAKVPADATSGNVTVSNGQGTSNAVVFTVVSPAGNPPSITSLNPTSGNIGSQTTINGADLAGVTNVTVNGTNAPTFSVTNSTTMTITIPAGASTGPVVVTHPVNGSSNGVTFTVTNPPTITGLNPTSGKAGDSVVITGTNFNGTSVTFNGVAATFVVDSPTQITAVVPSGATTGNVVVTTSSGSSNGVAFTVTVTQLSWSFTWRKTGLNGPRNACYDTNNIICIANSGANNVARFDTNGNPLASISDASFSGVVSVAVDGSGNHYVGCYNTYKVQRFDSNWANRVELITATYRIQDIAAEYGSSIVVLESQGGVDGKVEVFNSSGTLIYGPWNIASANTPLSIALTSDGNSVLIADSSAHYVRRYSLAGVLQGSYGGSGSGDGQFSYPDSIHVDSSGKVYIGDSGNYRFQVFDSSMAFYGKFTGSNGTGDGQFSQTIGIVLDQSGNTYCIDFDGNNIQKFTKN